SDRAVITDDCGMVVTDMQHGVILDRGAGADANRPVIRPDHDTKPDAGFLTDLNVADQDGGRCDKSGGGDFRAFPAIFDEHRSPSAKSLCPTCRFKRRSLERTSTQDPS